VESVLEFNPDSEQAKRLLARLSSDRVCRATNGKRKARKRRSVWSGFSCERSLGSFLHTAQIPVAGQVRWSNACKLTHSCYRNAAKVDSTGVRLLISFVALD